MRWHQRRYYGVPTSHLCFRDLAECPWTRALLIRVFTWRLKEPLVLRLFSTKVLLWWPMLTKTETQSHTRAGPPWSMYHDDMKGVQKTVISATWGQKWRRGAAGGTWRGWFMRMSSSWRLQQVLLENSRFPFLSINKSLDASIKDIVWGFFLSILLPEQGP